MKKVLSVFTGIIAFAVCMVLFLVQMVTFSLINVKSFVNKDVINDVVNNINVSELIESDETNNEFYKVTDELGISRNTVNEALNSPYIKNLVSKVLVNTYIEITTGETQEKITKEELITSISNTIDLVNEKEINVDENQSKIILSFVEKNYDKVLSTLSLSDKLLENFDTNTAKTLHFTFSTLAIVSLIFVMLVFAFIIALLRWSAYKWAMWTGVTTLFSSIIIFTLGFFINYIIQFVKIEQEYESAMLIVKTFATNFRTSLMISGGVGLILGILQIVLFVLVIKKKKKKIDINSLEKELEM